MKWSRFRRFWLKNCWLTIAITIAATIIILIMTFRHTETSMKIRFAKLEHLRLQNIYFELSLLHLCTKYFVCIFQFVLHLAHTWNKMILNKISIKFHRQWIWIRYRYFLTSPCAHVCISFFFFCELSEETSTENKWCKFVFRSNRFVSLHLA